MLIAKVVGTAVVLLAAYFLRGMAGFGSGIVAVPMLALAWPLATIVPVMAALNYLSSLSLGVVDREKTLWRELLPMLPGNLIGVLLALYTFHTLNDEILGRLLGAFVIAYGLYILSGVQVGKLSRWFAPAFGAIGGAINTLFLSGGPFFVVYLRSRRFDKGAFRATISTLFFVEAPVRLVGYVASGFYTWTIMWMLAGAVPVMALGLYLGHRVHIKLSQRTFDRALGILLLGNGLLLVAK